MLWTQLDGPRARRTTGQFTAFKTTDVRVFEVVVYSPALSPSPTWQKIAEERWAIQWCAYGQTKPEKKATPIRILDRRGAVVSDKGTVCCGTTVPQFKQAETGVMEPVPAQVGTNCDFLETPHALSFTSLTAERGDRYGGFVVGRASYLHRSKTLRLSTLFNPWKRGPYAGSVGPVAAREDGFALQWCVIGVKKEAQARVEEIDSDERQPQSSMARSRWEERVAAIQMEGASCLTCKFPSCDATVGDRFSTYRPEKRRRSGRG